jgi:hypothetical protein
MELRFIGQKLISAAGLNSLNLRSPPSTFIGPSSRLYFARCPNFTSNPFVRTNAASGIP